MNTIFNDNTLTIGNTPLVKLNRITDGAKATILAKIEGRNPAFSVKCRIGAAMVWDAEKQGILRTGVEIVEPTSGNTGIALAYVAAARGYSITLTMPDNMSIERRKILKAFGANLVLTDAYEGMQGAVSQAEKLYEKDPERYLILQQFKNPANPTIHETTTGPEIWRDTNGKVDILVAGVGTGGTITGVSRYVKHIKKKLITSVAVEPEDSSIISQTLSGEKPEPRLHKIQGIGAGFIPDILDLDLIDQVVTVSDEEAIEYSRRLAKEEGILAGISCGAATAAAIKVGKDPKHEDSTIVVVLPDSGERYLSSTLYSEIL